MLPTPWHWALPTSQRRSPSVVPALGAGEKPGGSRRPKGKEERSVPGTVKGLLSSGCPSPAAVSPRLLRGAPGVHASVSQACGRVEGGELLPFKLALPHCLPRGGVSAHFLLYQELMALAYNLKQRRRGRRQAGTLPGRTRIRRSGKVLGDRRASLCDR